MPPFTHDMRVLAQRVDAAYRSGGPIPRALRDEFCAAFRSEGDTQDVSLVRYAHVVMAGPFTD